MSPMEVDIRLWRFHFLLALGYKKPDREVDSDQQPSIEPQVGFVIPGPFRMPEIVETHLPE